MPGIHLKGLTQYGGTMTDAELVMYVVKQDDTSLGGANGSGYKLPVSEGLVTTDGTNPVSVNGGGIINLNGGTLDWPGTPVSGNVVVTEGDQTLYNKTLLPRDQEVGPKIDIRHTDLRLIKSQTTSPEDFGTRAIFSMALLNTLNDFTYQLPKNDGLSTLADLETAQTLTNKTISGGGIDDAAISRGTIDIGDSDFQLWDASPGSGRNARFEILGTAAEALTFNLPDPPGTSTDLVTDDATQTLTNKTLTAPTISSTGFSNAQHNHSAANSGGTIDHGALTGKGDDDHTQYYNQTRGDARYSQTGHTHTHGGLTGLGDDDHTQYHNNTRGDTRYYTKTNLSTSGQSNVHWNNITNEPSTYAPSAHTHDDRYYTESESNTRYYTKTNMQTSGQSSVHWNNITNEPSVYPPGLHTHDFVDDIVNRPDGYVVADYVAWLQDSSYGPGDISKTTTIPAGWQVCIVNWFVNPNGFNDASRSGSFAVRYSESIQGMSHVLMSSSGDVGSVSFGYNGSTHVITLSVNSGGGATARADLIRIK